MPSVMPPSWPSSPGSALPPRLAAMPRQAREAILRIQAGRGTALDHSWTDPARLLVDAGYTPDAWQADLMRSFSRRKLLLCARQTGKSLTSAGLTLRTALLEAPA